MVSRLHRMGLVRLVPLTAAGRGLTPCTRSTSREPGRTQSPMTIAVEFETLPIAETKLLLPRLRPEMVARPRVQEILERDDVTLTLVTAPPGYGKTVAARAWHESASGAVAWVTLEAGDNDPVRFWTYAAMAVERVRGGLGRGALRRLKSPGNPIESAVIELMNGIATFGAPLTLVLDDFQSITDLECLDSIDYALEHLPPATRLMVMTRSDPSLNLARLRASGALAEVRASDLALTSRGGERPARRTGRACSWARRGRGATRANGGLAGSPLPRVALASQRRESARSGA